MTKEQVEDILWKLKDLEWQYHRTNDGPNETRCPSGCVLYHNYGNEPILEHMIGCYFKDILDTLKGELKGK